MLHMEKPLWSSFVFLFLLFIVIAAWTRFVLYNRMLFVIKDLIKYVTKVLQNTIWVGIRCLVEVSCELVQKPLQPWAILKPKLDDDRSLFLWKPWDGRWETQPSLPMMHCVDSSHWRAQLSDVIALIISGHRVTRVALDKSRDYYLLASVIEANLGVSLGVSVAHRLPLTRHFPKPIHWATVKQCHS